ncbi:hypothetical protein M1O17_02005 [Dehalococcoidia bacterium]|nr:hypothetical protein [Dehalococcoidia bacterium]
MRLFELDIEEMRLGMNFTLDYLPLISRWYAIMQAKSANVELVDGPGPNRTKACFVA